MWLARPGSAAQQRSFAAAMTEAVAAEYTLVIAEAGDAHAADVAGRRRILARLQRELHRIGQRDHFPPPERDAARRAVRDLARLVEVAS